MRTTMPPLAVPSSLVSTMPVRPTASWNSLACWIPFCPVGASRTIRLSCGAPGSCRDTTLRSLVSSSIRLDLVWRRPAVSTRSTSTPRAVAALTASKTTAAGAAQRGRELARAGSLAGTVDAKHEHDARLRGELERSRRARQRLLEEPAEQPAHVLARQRAGALGLGPELAHDLRSVGGAQVGDDQQLFQLLEHGFVDGS